MRLFRLLAHGIRNLDDLECEPLGARRVLITAPRRDGLPPEADLPVWNLDAGRVSR